MQIRERSRWARRTGSYGEDGCDHVQNTARGVVSSAPSRRSSKRISVGKRLVCKNGEQRETLKSVQVENAVEVIRVERTRSDIASLKLEFDNSQRREREGDIVNRETKAITAVFDAATFTSVNGEKWVNLVRDRASSDDGREVDFLIVKQ